MKRKIFILLICFFVCSYMSFSENYSLFRKNGSYGIINEDRKVIIEPAYEWISIYENAILCGTYDGIDEVYDKSLRLLYTDSWNAFNYISENEFLLRESFTGREKLLNLKTGDITIDFDRDKYIKGYGYRDNLALVLGYGGLFIIEDRKGNVILSDIRDAHSVYTEGMLAVILENGKSGFVNKNGKLVIETSFYINFDDYGPKIRPIIRYYFNDNYALVKNADEKWVQYTIKGDMTPLPENIVPVCYCYSNGLVPVLNTKTNKYGYMDPKLNIVIPFKFSDAEGFSGSYAVVKYDDKDAVIDKKGNIYFCEEFQ